MTDTPITREAVEQLMHILQFRANSINMNYLQHPIADDLRSAADRLIALRDELDRVTYERNQARTISRIRAKHVRSVRLMRHRAEQAEARVAELEAFVVDFADAKFTRIDFRAQDPQDDLDPLTDYLTIEAWQDDARAALMPQEPTDD